MNIFTFSNARQHLSEVLNLAQQDGKVYIKRKDGSLFSIHPEPTIRSPFEGVKGQNMMLNEEEIITITRESRDRQYDTLS